MHLCSGNGVWKIIDGEQTQVCERERREELVTKRGWDWWSASVWEMKIESEREK